MRGPWRCRTVAIAWAAALVGAAAAEERPAQWSLSLGLSSSQLEHREFADDGARLLVESGLLPGMLATAGRRSGRWQLSAGLEVAGGAVDHQGRTQSGAALATRTDRALRVVRVGVMRELDDAGRQALGIGLSHHRWARRIRGRGGVVGLDEQHSHWTASVDARLGLARAPGARVDLDLRVGRTFGTELAVDFGGHFDRATLAPADRWHARLSLPVGVAVGPRSMLLVEPGIERWRFGRSDDEPLRRDGQAVGVVRQPRSEALSVDLRLMWRQTF